MLKVDGLKWGRTYMAGEFDLPEGYDYGRNEVCTIIAAAAQPGETRITAELENRLRRQALMKAHPEIADETVEVGAIIVGLPRTGSTMLHRLLASALTSEFSAAPAFPGCGTGCVRR